MSDNKETVEVGTCSYVTARTDLVELKGEQDD